MDDPGGSSIISSIILILVLTVINAFLAGAEMAFVSLNPAKIKDLADQGDKRARKVQRLLSDSDSFLSAIQVGITLAGFFNSASASQSFVGLLAPALGGIPGAETIATIIVTIIVAYISLVLGELYPKQLAIQVPEAYALRSAGAILKMRAAFRPFIWLLNASTGLLKRITPIDFTKKEEKLTRQEMKALLNSSRNDGAIDMEEFNMMRGVLSLDTRLVREIMVPRVDTHMLDADDPHEKNMELLLDQLHSRIPLYEEDKDHIVGIIHLKDVLLNLQALNDASLTLRDIARPALFVPDTMYTDELLVKFQQSKQHLAVLVDEFGGVAGIVTMEDLIEEIVGDIRDEYDDDDAQPLVMVNDTEAVLMGSLPLSDLNRAFDLELISQEADTIAGYIIERLGYIPKPGDTPTVENERFTLKVLRSNTTRIEAVQITLKVPADGENGEDFPEED
ncbi:MAG: hemolysin family protein [Eubacteriales bacterium]|nr:hemolysin family protein [Eubacteriales bacterium]